MGANDGEARTRTHQKTQPPISTFHTLTVHDGMHHGMRKFETTYRNYISSRCCPQVRTVLLLLRPLKNRATVSTSTAMKC